ncbi:hypothetical protein FACS1894179_08700 [Bacteroidia bacterium]|nr:hypothetical protein FACS1894179_08700 [Bacteroidia bacterium]
MAAQMSMGGGRSPMQNRNINSGGQDFILMSIPDIPGLTLDQREKLSKTISDGRKDTSKLMEEKLELKMKSDNPGLAEKKRQKLMEKMIKVDTLYAQLQVYSSDGIRPRKHRISIL